MGLKRLATVTALVCLASLATAGATAATAAAPAAFIRVDQAGFTTAETKHAYLLSTRAAPGARFTVVDAGGRTVLTGRAGTRLGDWNAKYPHVYLIDLSNVRTQGAYRIKTTGSVATTSPAFRVGTSALYLDPARKARTFFTGQRDGADVVPGDLGRKPAHLNDRRAEVYDHPTFTGPGTDQISGELRRIGGPVDVSGGWFDAGDYLKFTHIMAYANTMVWASVRDGAPDDALRREARHGIDWLDKMWDERTKTLYIQVGIGAGNAEGTFVGDHDVWRLPEADDNDTATGRHFIRNRPVFRAAAPGQPISPNLAGRTAAAFALAAQSETDLTRARDLLDKAAQVYALAKTENVGQLITSLPYAFYPESPWRDDMELGGTQLALAALRLGDNRLNGWVRDAAHWARQYLTHEAGGDTLNLYDVSALAHADLTRVLRRVNVSGLAVTADDLIGDLRAQLNIGATRSAADPFRAGAQYDNFDAVPRTFGLAATSRLYRSVTGDPTFDTFGNRQRGWAFGANPWGVSFMVGVGENYEKCPHHQVANLRKRDAVGAVVNGPNSAGLFSGGLGGHFAEMNKCPADGVDRYEEFTGKGSRYVDDVRSWQASEPAIDFAAIGLYANTLMSRG
ncbi:glycoside hydrolase family 9 protein [Rhizohabitans arisaemae]|uniref:glycoside hydrolase family 9 protein n=1 Tax=Rhizohabitans arisaemae TaxID=2720610 RepID=UPI0024B2544E|nr:glycoside hydrolase family 9 protein [Rhizohabitans arisaemae]